MGFGINIVLVILISPTAIASGFVGFKNAKTSCVAGKPSSSLSFDPARNKARVNLESRRTKRTPYIPGGLLRGDPDNSFLLYTEACFSPNQRGFLQKSCDEFPYSSEQELPPQPSAGDGARCAPAGRCLGETRNSTANLLHILLFFITYRRMRVSVTSLDNSLNESFLPKLFSLLSDVFFSLLIWSPTWEYGCYRMFGTSLRQAAAD